MKTVLLAVLGVVLASSSAYAVLEVQTSWYLGPGELGPVLHWGERFYESDSVAYLVAGKLLLSAASMNVNDWVKHSIDVDPDIEAHANILPVDLNGDGRMDLVSLIGGGENQVVWYERSTARYSKGYTKHVVGSFITGYVATTWPWDMDLDGDIDIVASGDEGLVWFENDNLVFTKHAIEDTGAFLYARPGDVDNDGDVDIVTHDKMGGFGMFGSLWLFRNDGSMSFSMESIYGATGEEIWRVNLADFNGDGFPDIQTSCWPVYVFLNDGAGHFVKSYTLDTIDTDGSWPSDFDADGDVDIMAATWGGMSPPVPLFWLENDGTGVNFTYHFIGGSSGDYGDGSMAVDVNLDGRMDALGTYRYVGWFEQQEDGSFVERQVPNGYFYHSHWVYGENLDGDPCTGDVDIDMVATKDGEFAWWENRMLTFASLAWLESSILDGGEPVSWERFGWDDHVPTGNELRYRARSGSSVGEILAAPWSSPILFSGDTLSKYGVSPGQYFQYRIEFERTTGAPDRSPTVYEVWVEWDTLGVMGLVTGGGWIPGDPPGPGDKRTFGFNAHSEGVKVWGQLQFNDHETKMKVHSDTVKTLVIQPGDTVANFSGDCRVDHVSGYTFNCEVMDRGEPGHYVDWFSIEVYDADANLYYTAADYLGGGNIQIHKKPGRGFADDGSETELEPGPDRKLPRETSDGPQVLHTGEEVPHISPNPFGSFTTISFRVPPQERGRVTEDSRRMTLSIYDLSGGLIRTLLDEPSNDGTIQLSHQVVWDGTDDRGRRVPAGVYFCRLNAEESVATAKVMVLR